MSRNPIEDVLLTSVEQEVAFCFECHTEERARQIQAAVISGQCVHDWRIQNGAFIALLRLHSVEQVSDYCRDFHRLCQHHRDAIRSVRFSIGDDTREFAVCDLIAA